MGVEDDDSDDESEGEDDIGNVWNEMAMAMESSKVNMSQHFCCI